MMARNFASLSRRATSASTRSVMSIATPPICSATPLASRTVDVSSSSHRTAPSGRTMRYIAVASPLASRSRRHCSTKARSSGCTAFNHNEASAWNASGGRPYTRAKESATASISDPSGRALQTTISTRPSTSRILSSA